MNFYHRVWFFLASETPDWISLLIKFVYIEILILNIFTPISYCHNMPTVLFPLFQHFMHILVIASGHQKNRYKTILQEVFLPLRWRWKSGWHVTKLSPLIWSEHLCKMISYRSCSDLDNTLLSCLLILRKGIGKFWFTSTSFQQIWWRLIELSIDCAQSHPETSKIIAKDF